MTCLIACDCGVRLRAGSEPAVLAAMARHLRDAHPQLAGAPASLEDLRALVEHDDDAA